MKKNIYKFLKKKILNDSKKNFIHYISLIQEKNIKSLSNK